MWCSRPDALQLASSVRTTRTFRLDAHQCLETLNYSRLHPSGRNGKSSEHYYEFEKNLVFKCIRPDDVALLSGRRGNTVRSLCQYRLDSIQCSTSSWISCSDTDGEMATVRTEGQHRPDAFQASRKMYAHVSMFLS